MTQENRLADLMIELGTDYKQLRTWLTGSPTGDLNSLSTDAKTSLAAALNELASEIVSAGGPPPDATETVEGVGTVASLAEMTTGTSHTNKFATPAGVRQELEALRAQILGGVGPAFDTLSELLAVAQGAEESSVIADLVTVVGTKADAADVYTKTEIGNPEFDLVAAYQAAKTA